jgi:hypothetical protein
VGIAEAAYREALAYARKRVQFGQPIIAIPAVSRMLLTMRGEIEAARALLYEAARLVDLKKATERRLERGTPGPDDRQRVKQFDRLASVLTPLVKYSATEMGNRVCYQAMQIHGGAGYMRDFAVERLYRDVRATSIYEGTSQLQIVAATGGILGHALDDLLSEWAAQDYAELAAFKGQLEQATQSLSRCIDALKGQDQALIGYYAVDLTELTVFVLNCWLLLRGAQRTEAKKDVAEVYITQALPRMRSLADTILAADPTPLRARGAILELA